VKVWREAFAENNSRDNCKKGAKGQSWNNTALMLIHCVFHGRRGGPFAPLKYTLASFH
jgi:hypothetical protein